MFGYAGRPGLRAAWDSRPDRPARDGGSRRGDRRGVARPVPGFGIAVPALLPGIFAALVAVALHPVAVAGLAYAGGTLGTLLGADLVNLPKVRRLGAPVVSIGGAGTFDGVFITGIIAVLLASLL